MAPRRTPTEGPEEHAFAHCGPPSTMNAPSVRLDGRKIKECAAHRSSWTAESTWCAEEPRADLDEPLRRVGHEEGGLAAAAAAQADRAPRAPPRTAAAVATPESIRRTLRCPMVAPDHRLEQRKWVQPRISVSMPLLRQAGQVEARGAVAATSLSTHPSSASGTEQRAGAGIDLEVRAQAAQGRVYSPLRIVPSVAITPILRLRAGTRRRAARPARSPRPPARRPRCLHRVQRQRRRRYCRRRPAA